jgi:hypothetical protein
MHLSEGGKHEEVPGIYLWQFRLQRQRLLERLSFFYMPVVGRPDLSYTLSFDSDVANLGFRSIDSSIFVPIPAFETHIF